MTIQVRSFEPIANRNAETLILGSMPGVASLNAQQYYAHPQNAFWRIVGALFRFDPTAPYAERVHELKQHRIALWDVLKACKREGSLDARIERDAQIPNDFAAFFAGHRNIKHVFFNGATAEGCYVRHFGGAAKNSGLRYTRLPSTSPAHASLSFAQKLKEWKVIVQNEDQRV